MKTDYTPSPWNIFRQDDEIYIEHSERLEAICEIAGGSGEKEDEANAKLISAAPELLQVAIKCLKWCNSMQSPEFVNQLRIETETVIRKATYEKI